MTTDGIIKELQDKGETNVTFHEDGRGITSEKGKITSTWLIRKGKLIRVPKK